MTRWTGIVLAPGAPADDRMASRVPAYLHPLAGRPLAWHALSALASLSPAPSRLLLVVDRELSPDLFHDVPGGVEVVLGTGADDPWSALEGVGVEEQVLLADARAPLLAGAVGPLPEAGFAVMLTDESGRPAAAWLGRERARGCLSRWEGLARLEEGESLWREADGVGGLVVRSRGAHARAAALVRDRLVERLMEGGVSFLLPESVWVDLDVRIGRDAMVYPGVVLEGQTTVGEETVIGPGCRIIDSWIGSGVELKGWNYISHTSIRNRAILEPYVRRGFD
jgi:hypothetical protein